MRGRIVGPVAAGVAAAVLGGFLGVGNLGGAVAFAAQEDEQPRGPEQIHPVHYPATQLFGGDMRRQRMLRRDLRLGLVYSQLDQPTKAIEYYERGLHGVRWTSKANELGTLLQLAKLYYTQGQNPSAETQDRDWYREALSTMKTWFAKKADPEPDSHYFMARIHYERGDFEAGIASLETAIRIAGERGVVVEEPWRQLFNLMRDSQGR